jgi:transcriptional regulator with XRE-family HTH domain
MTQAQLALAARVNRSDVSAVERNNPATKLAMVKRLLKALRVRIFLMSDSKPGYHRLGISYEGEGE